MTSRRDPAAASPKPSPRLRARWSCCSSSRGTRPLAIAWSVLHGEPGRWLDIHVSLLGGPAPDPARMRHVFAAMRALPAPSTPTVSARTSCGPPGARRSTAPPRVLHRQRPTARGSSLAGARTRQVGLRARPRGGRCGGPRRLTAPTGGAAPAERSVAPSMHLSQVGDSRLALSPEVGAWLGISDGSSDALPPGRAVPDGCAASATHVASGPGRFWSGASPGRPRRSSFSIRK